MICITKTFRFFLSLGCAGKTKRIIESERKFISRYIKFQCDLMWQGAKYTRQQKEKHASEKYLFIFERS